MAENHSDADRIYQPAAVECYSGYKACERPVAFSCQGRRWEIAEILDRMKIFDLSKIMYYPYQ